MNNNTKGISVNTIRAAMDTQEFGERIMEHIKTSNRVSAIVMKEVLELLLKTNKANIELIELLITNQE